MNNQLNLDILTKTFDDLPVGVGIFQVPDLKDIKQQVFNDWRAEQILKHRAESYAGLRSQYEIEIAPFQ